MSWRSDYDLEVVTSPDASWDVAMACFRDANMMQSVAYAGARWGSRRLVGLCLHDRRERRLAAVALAVVARTPLLRAGIAAVKFGPLWRADGHAPDRRALNAMLKALKAEFVDRRRLLLRIAPAADPDHRYTLPVRLAALGADRVNPVSDPDRYFVRLDEDDAMLASLASGWRRNLRKSERAGLEARELAGGEAISTFLGLYGAMLERKGFADTHGVQSLESLLRGADAGGLPARVLVAAAGPDAVAATVLVGSGDIVSVPFSATSEQALTRNAGYFLRWHAMRSARDRGARWLDLGGTEGNEGLRTFKTGNVGASGAIVPLAGEFDYCSNPLSEVAARAAEAGRRLLFRPGRIAAHSA